MVKMRLHLGLGSFGSFWVGEEGISQVQIFGFMRLKSFIFESVENMGYRCRNVSISQKVQIFCEGSILVKCGILYRGLSGSI